MIKVIKTLSKDPEMRKYINEAFERILEKDIWSGGSLYDLEFWEDKKDSSDGGE